jgi:hypothetical protein
MINWDFISPVMQTVSGIVVVHYVEDGMVNNWKPLAKFRTTVKPGSTGYKCIENSVPTNVFEAIKPQLDIMVRSFHQGVIMDNDDFTWIMEDELDKAREELRKVTHENTKQTNYNELKANTSTVQMG